jgi:predicted O-linked N-acetylglucosamine transferase (SPINDLY family)
MSSSDSQTINWKQQANQCLLNGDYLQASHLYETAIEAEPEIRSHYWNLGLILLLQGQEAEAQTTWLLAMAEGEAEEVEQWTTELVQVLQTEAERRESLEDWTVAWAIRQHIREINPTDIDNLLRLIQLSIKLGNYTGEELESSGILELLRSEPPLEVVNDEQLKDLFKSLFDFAPAHPSSLEFAEACLPYVVNCPDFIDTLMKSAIETKTLFGNVEIAIELCELGLRLDPNYSRLVSLTAGLYQDQRSNLKGIELAKLLFSLEKDLPQKAFASHLILRGMMHIGAKCIKEATAFLPQHEATLCSLIEAHPIGIEQEPTVRLFTTSFYFPYLRDDPKSNLDIRQKIAQLCKDNIDNYAKQTVERYRQNISSRTFNKTSTRPLKIGYLSHCLRVHSVGWLARWLFTYHNQEEFQVYAYLINAEGRQDHLQSQFVALAHKAYEFPVGSIEIPERISEDEIDILIDLDSITLDATCEIISAKPAPVQATWLGWDASGVSTIDYFIADPYVLPEDAQDYYAEKIWQLPQTYIAVDGFEVGIRTVRREDFDIPSDAVIYLSSQTGYKYNLQTSRLQMEIIKAVPNSYFLIKDVNDKEVIEDFFNQLAEEAGVNPDQIKFMSGVPLTSNHRANLGIADIVLDTFPYNGATTTLETLWMEIPMVTRVGQQFASRNSYTMMVNAGINEGIAWTDEEYVEWGIRLGTDEALRQQVAWKLRKSKQTAPLWNGKQFTREMEKAYQQMWQIYLDSRG